MRMDDSEIDAAVAAGTLRASDALALRRFVAERRAAPPPIARDAHLRYGGDGGILAALALLPLLGGGLAIATLVLGPAGGAPIAALAWLLSRRFAERREGAATTVLFAAFAIATAMTLLAVQGAIERFTPAQGIVVAGGSMLACLAYWRRFRLPLAFAAALVAALTIGDHVLMALAPAAGAGFVTAWMVVGALVVCAAATWWDMTDVYRQTIRADIAFWLHGIGALKLGVACGRIAFGVGDAPGGWAGLWAPPTSDILPAELAAGGLLWAGMALLAIAADRRAYLLFGTIFLLGGLLRAGGAAPAPAALLLVGAACTVLILWWRVVRGAVLARLPRRLVAQLPRAEPTFLCERPVA